MIDRDTFHLAPRDILAARHRIAGTVAVPPLEYSAPLSEMTNAEVYCKLECAQLTGSFKLRGATNALSAHASRSPIVACSAGNHALGVAHAAAMFGTEATLILPETASPAKIEALRRYPIHLILHGQTYDDAQTEALRIAHNEEWYFISPYNDPMVIAGQGTIGIEVLEQIPDTDLLLVPVGGGGLISGIALWARAVNPHIRIIGIQPAVSAVMTASLRAGQMITLPDAPSLADGLAGGVESDTMTLGLMQQMVDDMILVSEEQIATAMLWLLNEHHLVVEGSGAAGVAALLHGMVADIIDKRIVTILTGRNVATDVLARIWQRWC